MFVSRITRRNDLEFHIKDQRAPPLREDVVLYRTIEQYNLLFLKQLLSASKYVTEHRLEDFNNFFKIKTLRTFLFETTSKFCEICLNIISLN